LLPHKTASACTAARTGVLASLRSSSGRPFDPRGAGSSPARPIAFQLRVRWKDRPASASSVPRWRGETSIPSPPSCSASRGSDQRVSGTPSLSGRAPATRLLMQQRPHEHRRGTHHHLHWRDTSQFDASHRGPCRFQAQPFLKGHYEGQAPAPGDLCCGFAGRAYALLSFYHHTGEPSWLSARARWLTVLCGASPSSRSAATASTRVRSEWRCWPPISKRPSTRACRSSHRRAGLRAAPDRARYQGCPRQTMSRPSAMRQLTRRNHRRSPK